MAENSNKNDEFGAGFALFPLLTLGSQVFRNSLSMENSLSDELEIMLYRYHKDIDNWSNAVDHENFYITLGDVRRVQLKRNSELFQATLFSGSILILSGKVFQDWDISIPYEYHDRESTIIVKFSQN